MLFSTFFWACCIGVLLWSPQARWGAPIHAESRTWRSRVPLHMGWGCFSFTPQGDILSNAGQSRAVTWSWCDKVSKWVQIYWGHGVMVSLICSMWEWKATHIATPSSTGRCSGVCWVSAQGMSVSSDAHRVQKSLSGDFARLYFCGSCD